MRHQHPETQPKVVLLCQANEYDGKSCCCRGGRDPGFGAWVRVLVFVAEVAAGKSATGRHKKVHQRATNCKLFNILWVDVLEVQWLVETHAAQADGAHGRGGASPQPGRIVQQLVERFLDLNKQVSIVCWR